MEYIVIKNENQYVKFDFNSKITLTSNFTQAQRFTYENAKSLIQNNIKPKERDLYSIIEDKSSEPVYLQNEKTIFEEDGFCWDHTCGLIHKFFSEIEIYKSRLEKEFDEVQAEDNDIRHRIEFPKNNGKEFNASEMVKLFQLQRDTLRHRRKIKDDLMYIHIATSSAMEDFKSDRVMSRIRGMDNREYKPRVLDELFMS